MCGACWPANSVLIKRAQLNESETNATLKRRARALSTTTAEHALRSPRSDHSRKPPSPLVASRNVFVARLRACYMLNAQSTRSRLAPTSSQKGRPRLSLFGRVCENRRTSEFQGVQARWNVRGDMGGALGDDFPARRPQESVGKGRKERL
jgi:hypothetical protein